MFQQQETTWEVCRISIPVARRRLSVRYWTKVEKVDKGSNLKFLLASLSARLKAMPTTTNKRIKVHQLLLIIIPPDFEFSLFIVPGSQLLINY